MVETIVIGLDGANWDLLDPWLEANELPNIAELRERGTSADMESCLPPVTCPNWRCYSTGKNPGKLGVYWWEKIDTADRSLSVPTSRSFKSANYWDYLNKDGRTAGVVNLPMTYPPLDIDGFMISGGPGSEQRNYTTPRELGDELDGDGYQIHPDMTITSSSDEAAAKSVINLIDQRLKTFRRLLEERPVDVAHCTVFYINVLQHFFWREEPTRRAWQVIDEHIGAIRETFPDSTLLLMSDHGCTEIDTMFYANAWLEQEGYLKTTRDVTSMFDKLGVNKTRVSKIAQRFGLRDLLVHVTPDFISSRVPQDEEGAKRAQKLDRVDWDESQAVASGQGLVYLIRDDSAKLKITEELESLRSDVSEIPIAREVLSREEAYHGPYLDDAPDIVFDQMPGVHTSGAIGDNPVFESVSHWKAENVRTGMFLADGPDIVDDVGNTISITDIAPTILQSVDCPVPTDIDGETLRLFGKPAPETTEPIVPSFIAESADESVESRLEDLGYLQ